jgi:hypothetical protein
MSGPLLPDPDTPPARIFERRETADGLEQLARLGRRATAHYQAYVRANDVLAARATSTGELLLIDVPVKHSRIPFVLVGPSGIFAFHLATYDAGTEDDFGTVRRSVEALTSALSRVRATVRGAILMTGERAHHSPHYFQGGVAGSEGGFHVGVDQVGVFIDLYGDGVSDEDLERLRNLLEI